LGSIILTGKLGIPDHLYRYCVISIYLFPLPDWEVNLVLQK
jgi:hypothetical protein